MIKPCALIPDSVHTCCTLVPEMLRHLSLLVFLRFLTEIDCFFLPTYQMLTRPTVATQTNAALLVEELAAWTKNNSTALSVIQGKTSPAIWPNFVNHAEAATLWAALETKYGKAGGGHYLSPSSEHVQSTYDGFISVASPNSSLPRKLHADFSITSCKKSLHGSSKKSLDAKRRPTQSHQDRESINSHK